MATILIVDDLHTNRQFLVTLLGYGGHRLTEASDGVEALEIMHAEHPDLVITDILMPTMDGVEMVRRMRADPAIAHTTVIFYTATYREREARALAQTAGVPYVLAKPSEPQVILDTVNAALGVASPPLPSPLPIEVQPGPLSLLAETVYQGVKVWELVGLRLAALVELSLDVASKRDPLQLLEMFCHAARKIIGARYTAVGILADQGPALLHFVTSGMDRETVARLGLPAVDQGLIHQVLTRQRSVRLRLSDGDPGRSGFPLPHPPLHAFLGVPIATFTRQYGLLYFVDKLVADEFSEEEERMAATLAAQVAVAYENLRLYDEIQRQAGKLEQEVTERQQAEEAIRTLNAELEQRVAERTRELDQQRQRMQAILDTAGEGIVITDLDWRIEYINPAQERITGYAASEVIGQTTRIWRSDRTAPELYESMKQTLLHNETWSGEIVNRRKDGGLYDVALTVTPLRGANGDLVGFVGIHHDISRLKELDQLKSKFVSDVSHELRQPVINLRMYLDLLTRGKPEKREHYLTVLSDQADRLATLVESILDLSRLELGSARVAFTPVNLNEVVEKVVVAHQPRAEAAGLNLLFRPYPKLPPVRGEFNQLAQVATNLVANAINYTPAGEVQVITYLDPKSDQVYLQIQDTGIGIHPEDLPHLFERFYRGQHNSRADLPGNGLGLGIVKEIVDLHAGRIEVKSELGAGSIFRVWLPQASN